jgi:CubicO group peptidase (beta-lactamase class C family)
MATRGFSKAGLARLRDAMAAQVDAGHVPGMVYALSRGDESHVESIGTAEVGGGRPMESDAVFRITSMTRPITAAATLLLVADGRLALDEPVDAVLPELADRRVLHRLDGPVDNTVPVDRPITVRDLLTFRGGFGMILAPPSEYPVLMAEQALQLRSVGPPVPVTPHGPDEWMRRMGTLPLMDQPGTQWRYSTGSQILGVLVGRASGQPLESFYRERIFL